MVVYYRFASMLPSLIPFYLFGAQPLPPIPVGTFDSPVVPPLHYNDPRRCAVVFNLYHNNLYKAPQAGCFPSDFNNNNNQGDDGKYFKKKMEVQIVTLIYVHYLIFDILANLFFFEL